MTDLVIFDCDGVLVDSEPPANDVLIANLASYGLHVTHQEAERLFVGGTMAGVFQTARSMGADLPEGWVDDIYAAIYARLAEGVDLMPGVVALLDRLDAAGIPYCVGSNGSPDKMRVTLGQNGLWERFAPHMISAHTHGVAKPDPALYHLAAAQFNVPSERAVVVEDSRSGVRAAVGAGMRCFGLVPAGDGAHLEDLGAEVIRHLDEVPARLGL
ncbi:MAG: HAD family phosphatase [Pseudomonadota bacterium]